MPRTARIEYPGARYHVINRGNDRRRIFASDGAREAFERTLFEACERFGWRLHAYVIMRNHFHLALETPRANLSEGMKWLQGTWVARFNRLRKQVGRPFQGRFKSMPVEPGDALAEVSHYIHLNPVRAGVVSADGVGAFRWSSLHWLPQKSRPKSLDGLTVRAPAGGLPDTKSGWKRYQGYLTLRAREDPEDREKRFRNLSRGWCVGTEAFRAEMRARLTKSGSHRRATFTPLEPKARQAARERGWEKQLNVAVESAKLSLDELPVKKSDPGKVLVAAVMKTVTDASNAWLAGRLEMGAPASVSQFVRRFRVGGSERTAKFKRVLAIVKQCPLLESKGRMDSQNVREVGNAKGRALKPTVADPVEKMLTQSFR
jgi:putative transposase